MHEIEVWIDEEEGDVTVTSPKGAIQQKENRILSKNAHIVERYNIFSDKL